MTRKPHDPLATWLARGRIGRSQFLAAEEFREHFSAANASDPTSAAGRWLAKAYEELGADGSALVRSIIIQGMSTREIVASRGKSGAAWETYYSRRSVECLARLAVVFGFTQASLHTNPRSDHPPVLQRRDRVVE
jgi:hypothetical protein